MLKCQTMKHEPSLATQQETLQIGLILANRADLDQEQGDIKVVLLSPFQFGKE